MNLKILLSSFVLLLALFLVRTKSETVEIEEGLASHWNESTSNFNDKYLNQIFPVEYEKTLPSPEGVELTYKKLDAYFALKLLGRTPKSLESIIQKTNEILQETSELWRDETLIVSKNNYTGRLWLDTYCILAYLEADKAMTQNIINNIDDELWIGYEFYDRDETHWRIVSDETWCIMAVANFNDSLTQKLLRREIKDAEEFIDGAETELNKCATAIHMAMLFNSLKGKEYYPKFKTKHREFLEYSIECGKSNGFEVHPDFSANMVWIISKSGFEFYEDAEFFKKTMMNAERSDDQDFLTLQILKALYAFESIERN